MLELLLWSGIFVVSLFVLVKAAQYFTIAAEKIGLMLGISHFVIGVTIVAVGTSLPELISSIIAVLEDSSEIVVGNVLGSNIANIFLILGIAAILSKRLKITHNLLPVDLPILMTSAFLLALAIWDGMFTLGEAIIFVVCFIIFLIYTAKDGKANGKKSKEETEKLPFTIKPFLMILLSGFFVYLGAKYTIESVIRISGLFHVGTEVIAISAVAVGTSLPELAVTISSVKRKNAEMVVGNILGSNVFNTFAVTGIPGLFSDLKVPESLTTFGLPVMLVASILFLVVIVDRQVSKWEGWMFFIFYGFFLGKIFNFL
jgi:cation:H+ antiporter